MALIATIYIPVKLVISTTKIISLIVSYSHVWYAGRLGMGEGLTIVLKGASVINELSRFFQSLSTQK